MHPVQASPAVAEQAFTFLLARGFTLHERWVTGGESFRDGWRLTYASLSIQVIVQYMASAIVVISSDPPTLNTTSGAGAQTSPQITSAIVTLENESSQEHVSIWLPVDDSTDLQQGLKASHPDAIVSIVNNNGDGACNCSTDAHVNGKDSYNPISVAAVGSDIRTGPANS